MSEQKLCKFYKKKPNIELNIKIVIFITEIYHNQN
jgi:hypothetical protein